MSFPGASPAARPTVTTVVAAVIREAGGKLLVCRRPEGRHMGGLWEFPGGKVGSHEHPEAALVRELEEELGVQAAVGEPMTFAVHDELDRCILLLFYEARIVGGVPRPLDGQEIRWVTPTELARLKTPPADAQLLLRLQRESPLASL